MCEAAEKDLYAVLGASPSDSVQQLRHRYQQLALQYHPDRLECSSEAESGVKKFLEVDAAWRILSDQNNRRQYDLQRREIIRPYLNAAVSLSLPRTGAPVKRYLTTGPNNFSGKTLVLHMPALQNFARHELWI